MTETEAQRVAGIVSRGVAAIIDIAVVAVILGALYLGLALVRLMLSPAAFSFPAPNVVFSTAVGASISVLYLAGCWMVSGCTAGAIVMGLRVIGRRSDRMSPAAALLRAIACVVVPIGLFWVVVDARRRSLQDIVFGSRVIYCRPYHRSR